MCVFINFSKAQNWQWANHIGSSFNQYSERGDIFSDGSNVYLAGSYGGSLDLGFDTLNAAGANDMMLVKYDANGNGIWSKNFGGSGNIPNQWENMNGVFDPLGSLYLYWRKLLQHNNLR